MSYRNIAPDELTGFLAFVCANVFLNLLDIVVIFSGALGRKKQQNALLKVAATANDKKEVRKNLKVLPGMDIFDFGMRVWMSLLCYLFYSQKYYSTSDAAVSLSPLDSEGQRLMTMDWTGPEGRKAGEKLFLTFFLTLTFFP